jgi:hypothetical protein
MARRRENFIGKCAGPTEFTGAYSIYRRYSGTGTRCQDSTWYWLLVVGKNGGGWLARRLS